MLISTRSSSSSSAPFIDSAFRWDPNSTPPFVYMLEVAGFYFDFFVFSMFLHFHFPLFFVLCLLRPWLTWLWMLVYLCLFFYSLLKYSFNASFFVFIFFILEVSLSCSFVIAMVLWTMSTLLCCWLGKKNYLYLDHLCPTYPTLAPEFWTVWLYLWFLFLIKNKKKG